MSHFFDDARAWLAAALLLLVVLLLVAPMTVAAATVNDGAEEGSYVAAVLEFCPYLANSTRVEREEALYIMRRNMASWDVHMATANKQGANIFVTPEMGICGFAFNTREEVYPYLITLPTLHSALCTASGPVASVSPLAAELGCLARKHNMVLVVGLPHKVPCTRRTQQQCPADGHFQFNTQVAISETGSLLSTYHKTHLFGAEATYFDIPPWAPELSHFDTSFGVRFGQFICFDMDFVTPEVEEVHKLGITSFVFSTQWFNGFFTPLMPAAQMQQAFSRANNVTLLASGHGRTWRTSGSGIYQGGTILNYTFNAGMQDLDTLVIATVPIHTRTATPQATPDAALLRPPPPPPGNSLYANNPMASSPFVATKGAAGTLHVASGALHCSITYEVALASNPPEVYQAMAFFGMAFDASVPMEMCGVEVCPQGDCAAATMQAATTFSKLAVTTDTFTLDGGPVMPVAGFNASSTLLQPTAVAFSTTPTATALSATIALQGNSSEAHTNPVVTFLMYREQPPSDFD